MAGGGEESKKEEEVKTEDAVKEEQDKKALSQALKTRSAAKGWVTRYVNELTRLLKEPKVDVAAVKAAIKDVDGRMERLASAQEAVEQLLPPEKVEEDVDDAFTFLSKVTSVKGKAEHVLETASSSMNVSAKLPTLELSKFSGEPTEWPAFWDKFTALVGSQNISPVTKLTYLDSVLEGEAKAVIQGLSVTDANYKIAVEILEKRYGRKETQIFCHVQQILNLNADGTSTKSLWKLHDALRVHLRSLEALGVNSTQYGLILNPMLLSRLPQDIRLQWARKGEEKGSKESDVNGLLDFLLQEIQQRERSEAFNATSASSKVSPPARSTASSLQITSSQQGRKTCELCSKDNHSLERCFVLLNEPLEGRRNLLRSCGGCFKCLTAAPNHDYRKCRAKCALCGQRHHAVLCNGASGKKHDGMKNSSSAGIAQHSAAKETPQQIPQDRAVGLLSAPSMRKSYVMLQTIKVNVKGKHKAMQAVVLLDTGSDRTYVSERIVNQIQPQWISSQMLSYSAFGTTKSSEVVERDMYSLLLSKGENSLNVVATEIPIICAAISCPPLPSSLLTDFSFMEVVEGQDVTVDILIGLDAYWKVMTPSMKPLSDGLMAQRSIFGWIASGVVPISGDAVQAPSMQLFCGSDICASLQVMWDLDKADSTEVLESDGVMAQFEDSVSYHEGRYEVALPWLPEEDRPELLNNRCMALHRLHNLEKRLERDRLESDYNDVFEQYLRDGIIERVPATEIEQREHPIYYMPHHPVVKESSSTRVRPVFDASAKGKNGVSLNDCVHAGPSLLPSLPGVLMRFRRWRIGMTADIRKAFLQISVTPRDRNVHRFLWQKDEVWDMRFRRLPFGNKCSPFLLNATIKHHLQQFPDSNAISEMKTNLYVDDLLTGADDENEACELIRQINHTMDLASMSMVKWTSSAQEVTEVLHCEFHERLGAEQMLKVLGLRWVPGGDFFSFSGEFFRSDLCVTKRLILSLISRIFDPLGFLCPFVMSLKCVFQDVWRLSIGWDDVVPQQVQLFVQKWMFELEALKAWRVPRCYFITGWSGDFELHAFGDASAKGYGACVYLRQRQTASWVSTLVFAKGKVAPMKQTSLPRLELLAAVLCARVLNFCRDALKLPDVPLFCWTDSTIVLHWINGGPAKVNQFVTTRVREIRHLTSPSDWRHCSGNENPADRVSRGVCAEFMEEESAWLHGPEFLSKIEEFEPYHCRDADMATDAEGVGLATVSCTPDPLFECERWSSYVKAIRVAAFVLRACSRFQGKQIDGDLTFEELQAGKVALLRDTQQTLFPEEMCCLQTDKQVPKGSSVARLNPFLDL